MDFKLIFLCLIFSVPLFAAPQVQHWQTSEGTSVYFIAARELPMVDVQLIFDAGSTRDPAGKNGVALMTNSLLSEGAGGIDAEAISYEFERLGAVFNSDSGYDSATLSLRSLSDGKKLQPAVANLKRVMSSPDFPEIAIERLRKQLLVAIQQKQQSPGAIAQEAFQTLIYQDHPYAHPKEGTEITVTALHKKDIKLFYERYYVARNAIIVITGDLNRVAAESMAQDLVQELPVGDSATDIRPVKNLEQAKVIKQAHPSAQMHILLGQPGIKYGDPDYFPLYIGNHILGGSGLVSRLFKEVREKRGLSYSAYSYFSPRREAGPFLAGLQTREDQAEEALQVLQETINKFIKQGPDKKDLQAAKQNITGSFPLRIDSNSKLLGYAAVIGFYGLPLDYMDTFNANIEAVTREQIKEAFQRRLHPAKMVTVMVGPTATEIPNAAN